MGYALMFLNCIACRRTFGCNPHKVPSLVIDGVREPLCEGCANRWNQLHPDKARPIQDGAYEHFPEEEL